MALLSRTAWCLFLLGLLGCGGTQVTVMFAPPAGAIAPGERGDARVTVRFDYPGDSWAGRKVKVAIDSPSDVVVEPTTSEVTLDQKGSGVVNIGITPAKSATTGIRTLAISVTDSDGHDSTLDASIDVK